MLSIDGDAGVVTLRMLGSCDGCASSSVTLELAVRAAIEEAAPEITRIDGRREAEPTTGEAADGCDARHARPQARTRRPPMAPIYGLRALAPGRVGPLEIEGTKLIVCRVGDAALRVPQRLPDLRQRPRHGHGRRSGAALRGVRRGVRPAPSRAEPRRQHHAPRPAAAGRGRRRGPHRRGGGAMSDPLDVLQRIRQAPARPRPGERCDMCGELVPDEHEHVVNTESPQPHVHVPGLLAAVHEQRRRRRQVPRRARPLPGARRLSIAPAAGTSSRSR